LFIKTNRILWDKLAWDFILENSPEFSVPLWDRLVGWTQEQCPAKIPLELSSFGFEVDFYQKNGEPNLRALMGFFILVFAHVATSGAEGIHHFSFN